MLRKILTAISIIVFSCTVALAFSFPHRTPTDDSVLALIETAQNHGFKLLGVIDDPYGDYIMWLETPNGNCQAFFIQPRVKVINMFPSCAEGKAMWDSCVNKGFGCVNP